MKYIKPIAVFILVAAVVFLILFFSIPNTWVVAGATVIIAALNSVLIWINFFQIKQNRKDSIKPSVEIYLEPVPSTYHIFDVHVGNTGKGTAKNIKFKFDNLTPEVEDVYEYSLGKINKIWILKKGISSLAISQHARSFLFDTLELGREFEKSFFECSIGITISFEDIDGNEYELQSHFNFKEWEGIVFIDGMGSPRMVADQLKKIHKSIDNLTKKFK